MNNSQRGIIIRLVAIIILVLAIWSYFYFKSTNEISNSQTAEQSNAANTLLETMKRELGIDSQISKRLGLMGLSDGVITNNVTGFELSWNSFPDGTDTSYVYTKLAPDGLAINTSQNHTGLVQGAIQCEYGTRNKNRKYLFCIDTDQLQDKDVSAPLVQEYSPGIINKHYNPQFNYEFYIPNNWVEIKTNIYGGTTFIQAGHKSEFEEQIKSSQVTEGGASAVVQINEILFVIPLTKAEIEAHLAQNREYTGSIRDLKINEKVVTKILISERYGGGYEEHYILRNKKGDGVLIEAVFEENSMDSYISLREALELALLSFKFTL